MTELLLVGGGALIGMLLAMLGAGGSILLLPLLVVGAGVGPSEAVPLSLIVVTVLALANLWPVLVRRQLAIRPALLLGLPALLGAWLGGSLVKQGLIAPSVQLGVFTVAAVVAAVLMLRPIVPTSGRSQLRLSGGRSLALVGQGGLVGLLTGIAGVGGGFAIVPALALLAGLPMRLATGTSLVLIVLNSCVAFLALGVWPGALLPRLLPLLLGGGFGVLLGQVLQPHLRERQLRLGFVFLLIGSAALTGWQAFLLPVKQLDNMDSSPRSLR